jgi:hypothetical protein
MKSGRFAAASVLLDDGSVLVVGGSDGTSLIASAELYDAEASVWSEAPSMAMARRDPTATLLPGGGVLVAGGVGSEGPLASAERFDVEMECGGCGGGGGNGSGGGGNGSGGGGNGSGGSVDGDGDGEIDPDPPGAGCAHRRVGARSTAAWSALTCLAFLTALAMRRRSPHAPRPRSSTRIINQRRPPTREDS